MSLSRTPLFMSGLAVCLLTAALAAQPPVAEGAPADGRADSVLPSTTLVYLELPDLSRSRARLAQSALGRIRDEPAVDRFLSEGLPLATVLKSSLSRKLGMSWLDFREAFPGQVILALLDARPRETETLYWLGLVATVDPESPAFVRVREALLARYAESTDSQAIETEVADFPVKCFRARDGDTLLVATAQERFVVVRGPDGEHTTELLSGLLSQEGAKAADDPTFAAVRARSALDEEDLYFYVNLRGLLAALTPEMSGPLGRAFEVAGVNGVVAVALSLRVEPPGIRDQMYLLAPEPRRGLLAVVAGGELDEDRLLRYVPADAVSFSAGSVDLRACYQLLWDLAEALLGSQVSRARREVADFESRAGVSIGDDILAQLGPEMVNFAVLPRLGLASGRSDSLTVLAVSDGERLRSALDRLKTHFQESGEPSPGQVFQVLWEEREFDGHPLTRVVIANPLQPLEPSFAFFRDESATPPRELLLVALRFQSLRNMLAYVARDPAQAPAVRDIRANAAFLELRDRLPAKVSDLSYSDLRRQFLATYGRVVAWAALIQGASGETLFDHNLIPPPEAIAAHLFGLVTATTTDETGILLQSYGPVGYSTLVMGLGGGLGLALPQAVGRQRLASRDQCQLHLRRLGVELTLYASEHEGAFPESLEDLRDVLLARRSGAELPGDARWFRCPGRPLSADLGYEYVPGLTLDSPRQRIVCYDREGNHPGGRNVLFADGRVRWFREDLFQQILRAQKNGKELTPEEQETRAACVKRLKNLGGAWLIYTADSEGRMPENLEALLPYLGGAGARPLLACPSADESIPGYIYVKSADDMFRLEPPEEVMLIFDKRGNHRGGRNVLFVDGHVGWINEETFQKRWAEQRQKYDLPSLKELGDRIEEE